MATQLRALPSERRCGPSDSLASTFRACARDPSEAISSRLRNMLHTFIQRYNEPGKENSSLDREIAVKYSCQAEALYYRVLENVINQEKKRLGAKDLSGILENNQFQRSLVACCLEMVIFSHHSPGSLPQVFDIFTLAPFHFYKVIELVLRAEEGLLPGVLRHLNRVEEQILESLAWRSGSPLWESLRAIQGPVPACHQVMSSTHFEQTPNSVNGVYGNLAGGVPGSPITLHDRYISPPAGSAMTSDPATPVRPPRSSPVIITGQTVVTMAAATVTDNNGIEAITFIPVRLSVVGQGLPSTPQPQLHNPVPDRPQRGGSLSLFLRKVYHLASMHLRDFCAKLGISDPLRLKIWTCLEHSLVHCTELMLDRHLDQLLMCAIYVMAKVTREEMSFQCITKCYKTQPHASNSVYRSVLISGENANNSENSPIGTTRQHADGESSGALLTSQTPPTRPSGPRAASRQGQEERGHLIAFYNSVYSNQMTQFALRYSSCSITTTGVETPPLSPYPSQRRGSPRRLRPSNHHSLYISPLPQPSTPPPPRRRVLYYINRSPSQRLQEINNMIRLGESPTRRRCRAQEEEEEEGEDEGDGGPPVRRPRLERPSAWHRRLRALAQTRAQHQAQTRAQHQAQTRAQHQSASFIRPNM